MALFNATREVVVKVVYYGPAGSGKASNLAWLHDTLEALEKGKLVSVEAQGDRTLFFDCLPAGLAGLAGLQTRLQLVTVSGRVSDESTWRMILRGCDALVFVADSQRARLDENAASLRTLMADIVASGAPRDVPQVIQYNKRDMDTAAAIATLDERLDLGERPAFEAVARDGVGVEATLREAVRLLFERLSERHALALAPPAPAGTGAARAPAVRTRTTVSPASAASGLPPEDDAPRGEGVLPGQWLCLLDGQQRGPLEFEDLVDLVLASRWEQTRVWRPGLDTWRTAGEVTEVAAEIPPPLPFAPAKTVYWGGEDFPDFDTVPRLLRTVLIADEDEGFRRFLALPLAAQGFTIHEAGDGETAWRLAVENRPWLILADVNMPELDGFEFCRRIRSHPLLSRKPVVFISGSDNYKDRYRALQIGADDFLSKTMPMRELLIRMQLVMTRYSDLGVLQSPAGPGRGSLEGRIEVFGAPALLQMCSQGRLDGTLVVACEGEPARLAELVFRDGEILSAATGDATGIEAARLFLSWEKGRFVVKPGEVAPGPPLAGGVEALLLEAARRPDHETTS